MAEIAGTLKIEIDGVWYTIARRVAASELPDSKPTAPSIYDDEFDSGALDAKWTAINCSSGTVDILSTAATKDTYDAVTYTEMMALQPGRDNDSASGPEAEAAILRQTVSLATNCKVVCKIHNSATYSTANIDQSSAGILLSGTNGFNDDNYMLISATPGRTVDNIFTITAIGLHKIGGATPATLIVQSGAPASLDRLMLMKTGNDYSAWIGDGHTWAALTDGAAPDAIRFTFGAGVMTRLSIFSYWQPPSTETNLPNPTTLFDYIRYFENNTPLTNQ